MSCRLPFFRGDVRHAVLLQIWCHKPKPVVQIVWWIEAGNGASALLHRGRRHFAVEIQNAALFGRVPIKVDAGSSNGVGDVQSKVGFADTALRIHHDEALNWEPRAEHGFTRR